jgi:TolB-like protein
MKKTISLIIVLCVSISSAIAQSAKDTEIMRMAQELSASLKEKNKKVVVVADFTDLEGKVSTFGKSVADELTTNLINLSGTFRVIPTESLVNVFSTEGITLKDLTQLDQLKKLNKALGVDAIIIGKISEQSSKYRISAKILEIETGGYVKSSTIELPNDSLTRSDDLRRRMDSPGYETPKTEPYPVKPAADPDKNKSKAERIKRGSSFTFELQKCELSGQKVSCFLMIKNSSDKSERLALYNTAKLFDENGKTFKSSGIEIGGEERTEDSIPANGIPVSAKIVFEAVPADISKINLLQISCAYLGVNKGALYGMYKGMVSFPIEFTNIELNKR